MRICGYCQRDDHHLCTESDCEHTLKDKLRGSEKYHAPGQPARGKEK